nr:hypothetical protein CFP56_24953 [Quercus suber]
MGFFAWWWWVCCCRGGVSSCGGKGQMWVSMHGGGGVGCCRGGVSDGFSRGDSGGGGILVAELVVIGG